MPSLMPVVKRRDIMPDYLNTPVGVLLEHHNLGKQELSYKPGSLLIGMCMDNRKSINMPENFAYVIRTGGSNMMEVEFKISFTIALGKVNAVALIAHNDCGMVDLLLKKDDFVKGLVDNGGWSEEQATDHFDKYAPKFEIENEIEFVFKESKRLKSIFPPILIAPLFYSIEDKLLYQVVED
ncbi:hypothetical protein [Natranaerofaba carboxydovora]|uniref:hypothetical protein n=1 Tax=Natranaerofaba carboxydovora TaxID=2742683 RepID=UPI001F1361ED|nr:hypothetical protein [Natranaerofaba carboxydovora]UMZ73808.1 hypothetical protein ACONDI_01377 [Natranaerofaba carboxydovora]